MKHRTLTIAAACALLCSCTASAANDLSWPLPRASVRPTPLYFGLHVTPDPENNPIDPPERFSGYHVATDFETYPAERNKDVPVFAICTGRILSSGESEGYGGLITQRCTIDGQDVTVIYGHLDLDSLIDSGAEARSGQRIALLGDHKSRDSGDTRKHLHLGIHRGSGDVRGYVQTEEEIGEFIDPLSILRN